MIGPAGIQIKPQKNHGSSRSVVLLICLSLLLGAYLATAFSPPHQNVEESVVQPVDEYAEVRELADDREQLMLVLLEYKDDYELSSKARIAIKKFGGRARDVIERFGSADEFKAIFRDYGEGVVPIIDYYVNSNELIPQMQLAVGKAIKGMRNWVAALFNKDQSSSVPDLNSEVYGPDYKGAYAITRIQTGRHKFLDEFEWSAENAVVHKNGQMLVNGITDLSIGGLLEAERDRIKSGEWRWDKLAWAAADVAAIVGAAKAWKLIQASRLPMVRKIPKAAVRRIPEAPTGPPVVAKPTIRGHLGGVGKMVGTVLQPLDDIFRTLTKGPYKHMAGTVAWLCWSFISLVLMALLGGAWRTVASRRAGAASQ